MQTKNYNGNSMKKGIYAIRNIVNNKVYIGSTKTAFHTRKTKHCTSLQKNEHYNEYLQSSYNKHGDNNFIFEIIMFCSPDECEKWEAFFIKEYKSNEREFGFNIMPVSEYHFEYKLSEKALIERSFLKKEKAKNKNGLIERERGINKSVVLYNLDGSFIEKFASCKDLSLKLGWGRCVISTILTKRKLGFNKHIILYENDILSYEDVEIANKKYAKKKVFLYDLKLNFIKEFSCVDDAALFLGCQGAEVRMCCTNRRGRIKKYITKYDKI